MAIRIPADTSVLARSRFATSPAFEVVATLRSRGAVEQPVHARRWYARAVARLDARTLALLHALVPAAHGYTFDFLTPHPSQARETRDGMVAAIAATPSDQVAREVDFSIVGRPVHPEFVATFGTEARYRRWRRAAPPELATLLDAGETELADEAAHAVGRFFDVAIADDWPRATAVLDADIASRSESIAAHGLGAMLERLAPDIHWDGEALVLERAFDVVVDWAQDGVLLIPCTAHVGPVLFAAERPRVPVLTYAASGVAALFAPPVRRDRSGLDELIHPTRVEILELLTEPRTTQDISRVDGHAPATVSHHLGVLRRAGLVVSRRSGRGVVYRRTILGDALLSGELPEG